MKKMVIRLATFVLSLMLIFGSCNVWAEEIDKPTASADVGVFSKYLWRGYELSDDSIVIQPSSTLGYKGFSLNLWGNLDTKLDDGDPTTSDKKEWTETDLTLAYERSFGMVGLGVGYIYYGLDGVDDSEEIYINVGLDVFLSPTLTVYREIAHLPAWYINFGISHSFDLPNGMSLDLAGSLGYYYSDDDAFVGVDANLNPTTEKYQNLHDGIISAGLTIPISEYFSFNPMIAYSFPLSDEADNLLTSCSFSNDSCFIFGGATLSIAF
jgi:hypothetical protein